MPDYRCCITFNAYNKEKAKNLIRGMTEHVKNLKIEEIVAVKEEKKKKRSKK